MSGETIGARIREHRKIRRLSVRELATRVAVSPSAMEKYESGARNPAPGLVVRIARALAVGPERLTGQPYLNGSETEDQAQAVIPELRRIMLTYDSPDDLGAVPRPLSVLGAEMSEVARMRQAGSYVPMGPLLPPLLSELTQVALTTAGREQAQAYLLLATGYRAANSLSHKLGYHDLSLTAIERVRWAADRSGDPLMQVTGAYLKAGAMLRMGSYASARRLLTGLADEVLRLSPEECPTEAHNAVLGALYLKLSILEARDGQPARAAQYLDDARHVAALLRNSDTDHYELSFGPTNLRIHEVAGLIDGGDTEQALARLREWGAEQGADEWTLPADLPAERASHHHIDVASAKLARGDRAGSARALRTARRLAPNHTRFHPTTRATAATLVRLDRNPSEDVAELARWAGV
ncbi:helix-turn-helix domain-containing protein [Kitasatospora sp. MBT63]|uniref:helix-turn-helix domain-containing protein n=1 Tax=Kitasatospora sp. MBT63 TaxID=1444768 RepID=UPI000539FF04|nr:XRE family transcriptional regulator [Kitasatospora sp. MBT63]